MTSDLMNSTSLTVVRASSLSGYADCPRRAAARMFRQIVEAAGFKLRETGKSIGAAVGTSVHKAAFIMLSEKAKTGSLPPETVSSDAAAETMRAEIVDGMIWDRETPELNTAQQQVLRMARVYRTQVAPGIQPLIVEERLEAEVPWTRSKLVLSGQADVIAREPGRINDLKTGKRKGNHNGQIGAYALLARTNAIQDINEAGIDFVQRVTLKKPQPDAVRDSVPVERAEQTASNILRHIDGDLATFREGDPERRILPGDPAAFLANPSSMLCSPKWCPAFGTDWCHEHAIAIEAEAA